MLTGKGSLRQPAQSVQCEPRPGQAIQSADTPLFLNPHKEYTRHILLQKIINSTIVTEPPHCYNNLLLNHN